MRLPQINTSVLKYVVALMTAAGIFLTQAQAVIPVTYDPDRVMEPGGYKKGEEYEIKKTIEPPPERHTDTSGYEDRQIAYYQKKYKNLPSSWVAYLYKQCAKDRGCNIEKMLAASSRETSRLLRRPSMWSKVKNKISAYFAANLRASRAKRATPKKGLLIVFLERFAFWNKRDVAGEFVKKKIVEPTVAITRAVVKKTVEVIRKTASGVYLPPLMQLANDQSKVPGYMQNHLTRFVYEPDDPQIPEKVRKLYTHTPEWNPKNWEESYLECVAYAVMVYELNGISIADRQEGNASNWVNLTNTFNVYQSGVSSEKPKILDAIVWAANGNNHVGVVIDIQENKGNGKTTGILTVENSNSPMTEYRIKYSVSDNGKITIDGIVEYPGTTWLPSHWLRVKKQPNVKTK